MNSMRDDYVIVLNNINMDENDAVFLTYETPIVLEDFPRTLDPVWILGKKYSTLHDLESLKKDIQSRLWFTYRKNFSPIGGTGPTSDGGWGCMLRCGQMMLAQALICRHLGRDWLWDQSHPNQDYLRILRMFQDRKDSDYSIHQIAQMGVSEGKAVGSWFGPNTVAHVLKKLTKFDVWSSLVIHVAMDNTVIIDDIKNLCQNSDIQSTFLGNDVDTNLIDVKKNTEFSGVYESVNGTEMTNGESLYSKSHVCVKTWKPLLLIIPLRLGLNEINSVYVRSLKACFTLRQSVGMIGGRPNHAYYFVGFVGKQLVYLDPHTTHPVAFIDDMNDATYHCQIAGRMDIMQLDPSVAIGFICESEADFDSLCHHIHKLIIEPDKQPLFELCKTRPPHWPPPDELQDNFDIQPTSLLVLDERKYDTDEEFELLE